MYQNTKRARAIAIARTSNDNALYAFRLSVIATGALAALLVLFG